MNILILHMRFHPDQTGTAPLVTQLATDLTAAGDQVTVVTSMPHYGRTALPPEYHGKLWHRSTFQGVQVWRTLVYVPPNPSGFHRGLNFLSYTIMSIITGLLSGRQDIVLCINPPITVGFSGWLVSFLRHIPLVFNVQDVWPDCLVIIGQVRNRLLIRTFALLERFIYRVSSRITVLSEGMKRNLLLKHVEPAKVTVIPNWANLELVTPTEKLNKFRAHHQLQDHFVVLFAGNLGYIAVLETVLDAAKLIQHDPHILFLIVGEGNAKANLVAYAQQQGLTNVKFVTTQPEEMLSEMLGAADISLVTLNRRLGTLNVPSKVYSIMASQRPVLASVPADSEIVHLVEQAACGMCVPPEDARALARTIQILAQQPALLDYYGKNGRQYVEAHYERHMLTRQYRQLLHEVAGMD
jgi:colanic acid biosynthesis glycosyl transferase WcaI